MSEMLTTILQFVEIGLLVLTAAGLFIKLGRLFQVIEQNTADAAALKEDVAGVKNDIALVKVELTALKGSIDGMHDDGDSTRALATDAIRRIERIEIRLDQSRT